YFDQMGFVSELRSEALNGSASIGICDTFGEMGLWYRLAPMTLIGGTFGPTEGHNPWEPAALHSAILHGPRFSNFKSDFNILHGEAATILVDEHTLSPFLMQDHSAMISRAAELSYKARGALG